MAPDQSVRTQGPELVLSDDMIERAALAGTRAEGRCLDGTSCTHTTCHYRSVIEAAFEGVPITNYAIGLLLQFFEQVVCVKAGAGAGVYVRNEDPHGFDALCHHLNLTYRKDGSVSSITVSKIGAET